MSLIILLYFLFDWSCLKFPFHLYLSSFCLTFAFISSFFDDTSFCNPIIQCLLFPCHFSNFKVTFLHTFLSFPVISLHLSNLAGYFLLTLSVSVAAQLTQGSVLNCSVCKNSYVLSKFPASQDVPIAQFILFNMHLWEKTGTIFSIFSCWVTEEIFDQN